MYQSIAAFAVNVSIALSILVVTVVSVNTKKSIVAVMTLIALVFVISGCSDVVAEQPTSTSQGAAKARKIKQVEAYAKKLEKQEDHEYAVERAKEIARSKRNPKISIEAEVEHVAPFDISKLNS